MGIQCHTKRLIKVVFIFVDVSRYIEAVLTTKNDKDLLSYLEDYALSS